MLLSVIEVNLYVTYSLQIALDIAKVSATRATRVLTRLIDHVLDEAIVIKHALANNLEAHNVSAFFKKVGRSGGHRARKDTADIGMVSSRSREKYDLVGLLIENWTDDGDIWKMPITPLRST